MGWAKKGARCNAKKQGYRTTRYNIIAALNGKQLLAPFVFEGFSNTRIYEVYIEKVLAPSLTPGKVVVIDNARFHKSKKITQLIENVGCRVLFLPPYFPDFNPIEHYWAKIKRKIRKAAELLKDFYRATVNVLHELCNY